MDPMLVTSLARMVVPRTLRPRTSTRAGDLPHVNELCQAEEGNLLQPDSVSAGESMGKLAPDVPTSENRDDTDAMGALGRLTLSP